MVVRLEMSWEDCMGRGSWVSQWVGAGFNGSVERAAGQWPVTSDQSPVPASSSSAAAVAAARLCPHFHPLRKALAPRSLLVRSLARFSLCGARTPHLAQHSLTSNDDESKAQRQKGCLCHGHPRLGVRGEKGRRDSERASDCGLEMGYKSTSAVKCIYLWSWPSEVRLAIAGPHTSRWSRR
jgi:hypothetical protein